MVFNDKFNVDEVLSNDYSHIILSPGPGRPQMSSDVGHCMEILELWQRPLLGVCLGHQSLIYWSKGHVRHLKEVVHGQTSQVNHRKDGLFSGMPLAFEAMRYHSLIASEPLPECFEKTAWTDDIVMGVRHKSLPYFGVQFHPESIATTHGDTLIENFLKV